MQETWVWSLGQEDPLEKEEPTPIFLPEESHGQRSLVGYCPWGRKESDMIEWVTHSVSLYLLFLTFLIPHKKNESYVIHTSPDTAVKTNMDLPRPLKYNTWADSFLWRKIPS